MRSLQFLEDYSSQIPAIQLLVNMGYQYVSPIEALELRGNKESNVLLESILKAQLQKINTIRVSSSQTAEFSSENIDKAIYALKEIPLEEGYIHASKYMYSLLTNGKAFEQAINGNKRSYTMQFIDWVNFENNVFHVTEELAVKRTGSNNSYRPDIVLYVNGIPLSVIECKRADMKDPIGQAISQHIRNQREDGIRQLYVYAQQLISLAINDAKYGTNATTEEFWSHWKEQNNGKDYQEKLHRLKNTPLDESVVNEITNCRLKATKNQRAFIQEILNEQFEINEQDKLLLGLCSPNRLLSFMSDYTLYDNGIKKIARYQQYFAVNKSMQQLKAIERGRRLGGVVWHTQGSGKSLTMALLAQAIAKDESIKNPKIILVTDRTNLDDQITETFKNCGLAVENATTGKNLVRILESNTDSVITTIINKFETAVKKLRKPLTDQNIFVLIDEGHRSQNGTFNIEMQKSLPNACFIAFTGTPLFKKDKSTIVKFGKIIDQYTVDQAVDDGAVVPLIYEGRHAYQSVQNYPIDTFFETISEPHTDEEKADFKNKYSRRSHILDADPNIFSICMDISTHYRDNFQGTPFKGQLVCSSKATAVKYYNYLKQINIVSVDVVISPPDSREGNEDSFSESKDLVARFWKSKMDEHGNANTYETNIVNRFKYDDRPEIIIVVDKLLTGFDAPRNTVLYVTRKLRGHQLLQAIARVNRVYPDKDYGYIVDYAGLLEELDNALLTYSSFEDFDEADLQGTLVNIKQEIEKLEVAHTELRDIFKKVNNKNDIEEYQQILRPEDVRDEFYRKLTAFSRILKLALSSIEFHQTTPEKKIIEYKNDLAFFSNLRTAVARRYSDVIDYKKYEGQIQKLIDTHVSTERVEPITELVNIFDKDAFQKEVEEVTGKAAKADMIASRTKKYATENLEKDPAFYKKFSDLIQETINDFYNERITEIEYLNKIKEYSQKVLSRTDDTIPEKLKTYNHAKAYFGVLNSSLGNRIDGDFDDLFADASIHIDSIIERHIKVDWKKNIDVQKQIILEVGDYILDELREKLGIKIPFSEVDTIAEEILDVAKNRY